MYTANALSRAVDQEADVNVEQEEDTNIYVDSVKHSLPITSDRHSQFIEEIKKDKIMQDL